jgi:hypothetical protein
MLSKKWAKLAGGSEDGRTEDGLGVVCPVGDDFETRQRQAETQRPALRWRVSKHSAYFQFSSVQFSSGYGA